MNIKLPQSAKSPIFPRLPKWAVCLAALGGLAMAAGAQTVIYSDSFVKAGRSQPGGSTTTLKASTPETAPAGEWWKSYWSSTSNSFQVLGSNELSSPISTESTNLRAAFLDFTPQDGYVYTLSVDMSVENSIKGSGFIAMGFSNNLTDINTYATAADAWAGSNAYYTSEYTSSLTTGLGGWKLNADNTVASFKDAGYSGSVAGPSIAAGYNTFSVVLDTTQANWSIQFLLNGSSVRTETYETNPTISNVFLGAQYLNGGRFDNFSLTAQAIPEPKTGALLLFLSGLAATARLGVRLRRAAP